MPETKIKTDREEFLDDIIITAIEGGIGYWSVCHSYKWENQPEVIAVIQEFDEWDNEPIGDKITVNRDLIRKGLKEIIAGESNCHPNGVKVIAGATATNDGGEIDADLADVIVQVGCFGNIVYG